jgi:hypothetical protein
MRADPEPRNAVCHLDTQHSIATTNPDGTESPNLLDGCCGSALSRLKLRRACARTASGNWSKSRQNSGDA